MHKVFTIDICTLIPCCCHWLLSMFSLHFVFSVRSLLMIFIFLLLVDIFQIIARSIFLFPYCFRLCVCVLFKSLKYYHIFSLIILFLHFIFISFPNDTKRCSHIIYKRRKRLFTHTHTQYE